MQTSELQEGIGSQAVGEGFTLGPHFQGLHNAGIYCHGELLVSLTSKSSSRELSSDKSVPFPKAPWGQLGFEHCLPYCGLIPTFQSQRN